jgi:phosphatidylethanolamine-binding protein (PEBP) family uncharacterized protein
MSESNYVPRIRIEDLPVAEELTPEEKELLAGAGLRRSFRPTLEQLEAREVPANLAPGIDLDAGVLRVTGSNGPVRTGGDYAWTSQVRIVGADQLEVKREGQEAFRLNRAGITDIVFAGGTAKEIFSNYSGIPSTFENQGASDQHVEFKVNSPDIVGGVLDPATRGGTVRLTLPTAPPGTSTWAVVVEDFNAAGNSPGIRTMPDGTKRFTHLVAFNIPLGTQEINLGALPQGAVEGSDTWTGPNPPDGSGTHNYRFRVYALGAGFKAPAEGATQQQVMDAMQAHVTGRAEIWGTMAATR